MRCSMLFLSKDANLAIPLVLGLLKYWPFGNSIKEVIIFNLVIIFNRTFRGVRSM